MATKVWVCYKEGRGWSCDNKVVAVGMTHKECKFQTWLKYGKGLDYPTFFKRKNFSKLKLYFDTEYL